LTAIASILPVLIPALLTFIAAIAATSVGYRQWRKQNKFERSKGFLDDRAAAYKELWERLETRIIHSYPLEELRRERSLTEEGYATAADMQQIAEALRTADAARNAVLAEVRTNIGG
jgi:hypothetical protein